MDEDETGNDLFQGPDDVRLMQLLLEDLHGDLRGSLGRYRQLEILGQNFGSAGTMIFGGPTAFTAMAEARSSFVHGNFAATILLCQSLAENTLAGYLHARGQELPQKISFQVTIARCESAGILDAEVASDFKKLAGLRNPLSHFRPPSDDDSLLRRAMNTGEAVEDLLSSDAHFAMATVMHLLSRPPFRVG